ncbi:MAG: Holliday junction branch migration protein RuvA [Clostridia bacterium]|nr:Holliday junction branch migration protein RuvA [Clostridia bacterium]
MIAYIKGTLEEKSSKYVVIDVMGIGYKVFMSDRAINELGEIGDKVKVHTHYHVREDDISLFGFLTNEELRMFELLIQVSGIGAKSAITILANIDASTFALAVLANDVDSLKKIPGVGPKSAQRIILELQDKLKKENAEMIQAGKEEIEKEVKHSQNVEEAVQALQILGYNKREIEKAFDKLANTDVSVEELIKKGLSILSK